MADPKPDAAVHEGSPPGTLERCPVCNPKAVPRAPQLAGPPDGSRLPITADEQKELLAQYQRAQQGNQQYSSLLDLITGRRR